jgi:hypothetical protein
MRLAIVIWQKFGSTGVSVKSSLNENTCSITIELNTRGLWVKFL